MGTRARFNAHLHDLNEPAIASTGDAFLLEFTSVVEPVQCAVDVQKGMMTGRNASALDTDGSTSASVSISATCSLRATTSGRVVRHSLIRENDAIQQS